jgi:curved DNA-binding protein
MDVKDGGLMVGKKEYYSVLEVRRNASAKEIKQAYRRLARRYHPDVNPGDATAEQKFKEISEAYEVLGNPEQRQQYDRFGHQAFSGGFEQAFGAGKGFRGFNPGNLKDFFAGRGNFTEGVGTLFEEFFGKGGSRPQSAATPGQDIEQTVSIRFADAVHGTTTDVQVTRRGGGTEWLRVRIPPGVDSNSRVRLAGKGELGPAGGAVGDLYIVIQVQPHAYFVRQGDDILCEVPVTLAEVMLGARIDVPTIDGLTAMTLPAGTQNGRRFRLRGKGVPRLKGEGRGDQYITVKVILPETLDARSRQLVEELDKRHPLQPRAHMRW